MPAEGDKTIECRTCGVSFVFTADEQAFYESKGFMEPRKCPACRKAAKAQRQGGGGFGGGGHHGHGGGGGYGYAPRPPRQMFDTVCSACGEPTQVPFQPTGARPVYCRLCLEDTRQ